MRRQSAVTRRGSSAESGSLRRSTRHGTERSPNAAASSSRSSARRASASRASSRRRSPLSRPGSSKAAASPPDEAAAAAIRSVLGETDVATAAEEIAWAFRKVLEHAAADQSLIVVFDDIQWGEETFLDLIEHLALLS